MSQSKTNGFLITALGASAGGLEAFEEFFKHMPADSGIAFAVAQHLAPDHSSALPELLARHTRMIVEQARDDARVLPNRVYIIPPNATLTIKNGSLRVASPAEPRGHRTPIDSLFRSLAEDCGENAVCIMLSGTGSDGTMGLRAIKEHGGMAMAQTLESAKYDTILRSAIATGLVDHILPVKEMPAKLLEYAGHLHSPNDEVNGIREQARAHLGKIYGLLRRRAGHDFSQYKESTITRRLERRMRALQVQSVEQYLEVLESQPGEADQLFKDLLIGVTQFFRDPEAFEALRRDVIPKLFHGKVADDQVRVCVVGCASGEEAYSIGILLCEYAATLDDVPKIQIFATDIDERGLDAARKGRYPESIAEHVSAQRLERFFIKQDGMFVVNRELRELCIFSSHSFIKDPPYSRLDLISCRNVMIYLGLDLQQKVLPLFHYALRSGGYLFLGPSENASAQRELFRAIDKKDAIFQRKESTPRPGVRFPLTDIARPKPSDGSQSGQAPLALPKQLEGVILQRYAPACVVVKESGEAVYFSGPISRYLEQPTGSPEANVINMAREGLRVSLRTALHRAVTAHQRIVQKQISVQAAGGPSHIDLTVEPLPEFSDANLYMIVLAEVAPGPDQGNVSAESGAQETIRSLESELRLAKEQAQSAYEELETSNEELQSANEEYQSTNEELETSKEELQSFNEELETVNAELNRKVAELDHANSDLQNLLDSTQIATIFLDADLNIRNFTPAAGSMFRLIAGDVGRPITDLAAQFTDVDLVQDAKRVLVTLSPCVRAVTAAGGRHYQKRIMPYRTVHNVIAGVVLTFVDVTLVKQAEQLAKEAQCYAESIVDTVREALVVLDANLRVKSASKAFFETFKGAVNETLTKSFFELGNRQWDIPDLRVLLAELLARDNRIEDYQVEHEFLMLGRRTMLLNARKVQQADGNEPLLLLAIEDITDRKLALEAIRESERRRRELVEALPIAVYTTDADGLITMFNKAAAEFAGRVPVLGTESWCVSWKMYWPDGTPLPHDECPMAVALKERRPIYGAEGIVERPDGTLVNFIAYPTPLFDGFGNLTGAVNLVLDITERKAIDKEHLELLARERAFAAERALQVAQAELAHVVRALTVGELATSIAHEVNQPLAAIVTNAEACRRWLSGEPNLHEAEESLALIVRDGNRASEVIRRIREFLKKDRLPTTGVDINEVIQEAVALGRAELLKGLVTLRVELSHELSQVQGDRIQLQQVILNLIMNGREAMVFVVDRPRELVVTSQRSDDGIVVAVRDSGAGIEQQKLERMFDAFFTTKPAGMGMGLSISRSIVEAHGGRIWATNNDGPGLTVQFSVPIDNENPS